MKTCTQCGEEKTLAEFNRVSRARDGRETRCKACTRALSAQYYAANSDRRKASVMRYRAQHPEKHREWSRKHGRTTRYGLTTASRAALYSSQGGACPGCATTYADADLRVDHDHSCCPKDRSCGRCVRGLLCHGCNVALGHAQDDPATLRRLAEYLERHNSRQSAGAGEDA